MKAKLFWEIAASLQMLIGIVHFLGTCYSKLLYPKDKKLIEEMKITFLTIDKKTSQWNAWLFFNLAFSICLFMVGFLSFVLAYQDFALVQGISPFSICISVCTLITICFAHKLGIRKVRTAFAVILALYIASMV